MESFRTGCACRPPSRTRPSAPTRTLRQNRSSILPPWSIFPRRCWLGSACNFICPCIPEQNRQPARTVHGALHQQLMGHLQKLRMMLEVLCRRLHLMYHMFSGTQLAVKPRHADKQPLHQRKLSRQQRKLTLHAGLCARAYSLSPKRKLAADHRINQVIFKDLRMAAKERLIIAIVRQRVLPSEALKRSSRSVADAHGEGLHALYESRPDVRPMQQHSR